MPWSATPSTPAWSRASISRAPMWTPSSSGRETAGLCSNTSMSSIEAATDTISITPSTVILLPWSHESLLSQDGIAAFKELSKAVGKEKVIWRFDPIILSDITSEEWLCERFESLARDLHPFTSRVNISFVDFYGKVARRLNRITENSGVRFYDIRGDAERLLRIASRLSGIARSRSMDISGCAEDVDLTQAGIASGKCVSDELDIDPLRHHCERRERPLSEEGLPMRKQQGYRTVRHLHPRLCLLLCLIRHSGVRAKQGEP